MYLKKISESDAVKQEKNQRRSATQILESYKNVRANLMFTLAGKKNDKCKIIMFTSAEPGEGKTTTCVNMASVFAETNARVLIIDADLRRPKVERYITENRSMKGLSDYLGDFCELSDVIMRPKGCNFDCIFSGNIPPNPSELLMLDKVTEMFKELSEKYDYIFVDTPPVGIVSETLYITQFVTGVIIVAKKQTTHLKKVKDAISTLGFADANILGFVLNGSANSGVKRYYRYYKHRGYYYK